MKLYESLQVFRTSIFYQKLFPPPSYNSYRVRRASLMQVIWVVIDLKFDMKVFLRSRVKELDKVLVHEAL